MPDRLVLALDTATETTVVALGRCGARTATVVDSEEIEAPRAAMSRLLVTVNDILERNSYELSEVEQIACGRGPGSFTGVRIGVAAAKGLAHGLGVPLLGVGTLDAVAWRFSAFQGLVGIVGDAMRGEVYPALFRCGQGSVERLGADTVADPASVAKAWREHSGGILVAGNGLAKYGETFAEALGEASIAAPEAWAPSGQGLLTAVCSQIASCGGQGAPPGELLPVYTRLSDAEENECKRAGGMPPRTGVAGGPA